MAGVRSEPMSNGKYRGWFKDRHGRRKSFTGTTNKRETLKMAKELEETHKAARLSGMPDRSQAEKNASRSFSEVKKEYLDWGKSQGGRGGRPWSVMHAGIKESNLNWWEKELKLKVMADLWGVLPKAERGLRKLQADKRTGKTLKNYATSLKAFCAWCDKRQYLPENPLDEIQEFNTTPEKERRAFTPEEIADILKVADEHRRLLYETAIASGLRANELRALTLNSLDLDRSGLKLEGAWTKNRKAGFQPLPRRLVKELQAFGLARKAQDLYDRHFNSDKPSVVIPSKPLLFVPKHTSRMIQQDMKRAGIPVDTDEGYRDFHSLRVSFVTWVVELGGSVKEAQTLARHSTPELTMNVYSKARDERLHELAEMVGELTFGGEKRAPVVHPMAAGAEGQDVNALPHNPIHQENAGWGTRTRT